MTQGSKKLFDTQILVERDQEGVFVVSLHGIEGAHADGATLEKAVKNLNEVVALLKEHYGDKKFIQLVKKENRFLGIIPYDVEYV